MDALSDNDDVFEKSEKSNKLAKQMLPAAHKPKLLNVNTTPQPKSKSQSKRKSAEENSRRSHQRVRDRSRTPKHSQEEPTPQTPKMPLRREFVRARSAEPESNLSRKKSKSLPDLGLSSDTAGRQTNIIRWKVNSMQVLPPKTNFSIMSVCSQQVQETKGILGANYSEKVKI